MKGIEYKDGDIVDLTGEYSKPVRAIILEVGGKYSKATIFDRNVNYSMEDEYCNLEMNASAVLGNIYEISGAKP